MRKNLLLSLALFTALCIGVRADMTPAEQTDLENLINSGYSESAAEDIIILKNRATAKPSEPLYAQKHNKFVRFCKECYLYIDPAQSGKGKYHHDIVPSPHYTDL